MFRGNEMQGFSHLLKEIIHQTGGIPGCKECCMVAWSYFTQCVVKLSSAFILQQKFKFYTAKKIEGGL